MPRATRPKVSEAQSQSRSQGGAHSQPTQKRRGRIVEEEEEEVEEGENEENEEQIEDEDMEDVGSEGEAKVVDRKANDLVRLALSTEYRRTTLKRDEIAKKIFGGRASRGDLQPVLTNAQHILGKTFGMELHEIMSRAEKDKADAAREGAQAPGGENNMAGVKKKAATASSKQYILRSVLDSTILEAASVYDIEIEDAEKAELALWQPNNEDCRPEGTLLTWKYGNTDQLGMAGVLHVILALILVNGRVLTDMQLRTYLRRLRLPMGSAMPSNTTSQTVKPLAIDAYLAQLVKQSYLDKQKTSLASTQGGQKRARGGGVVGGGEDGDASFEWKWGTRAIAEIGEEGVGAFMVDFMDGIERERENRREEDGARGNNKMEREKIEKRKEMLFTVIGRAAGGGLVTFK